MCWCIYDEKKSGHARKTDFLHLTIRIRPDRCHKILKLLFWVAQIVVAFFSLLHFISSIFSLHKKKRLPKLTKNHVKVFCGEQCSSPIQKFNTSTVHLRNEITIRSLFCSITMQFCQKNNNINTTSSPHHLDNIVHCWRSVLQIV